VKQSHKLDREMDIGIDTSRDLFERQEEFAVVRIWSGLV